MEDDFDDVVGKDELAALQEKAIPNPDKK